MWFWYLLYFHKSLLAYLPGLDVCVLFCVFSVYAINALIILCMCAGSLERWCLDNAISEKNLMCWFVLCFLAFLNHTLSVCVP